MTGVQKTSIWFALACVAAGGAWMYARSNGGFTPRTEAAAKLPDLHKNPPLVSALGHIEPKDGVISLSARSISGQPSILSELKVHEGDWVKAGQVLAVLDSHRQLEQAVENLHAGMVVAQSHLAVAKTGAKKGDLAAQQAEIARIEAELAAAKIEADRFEQLYEKQAATVIERDQRRLRVEVAAQSLNAARNRLTSLEEVRDVDVQAAEAEVQAAAANIARAEKDVEPSIVRAPFSGRVLTIHAHPGEEVGPKGLLELGRTDQMYVIAEVVESDVSRLRPGQKADITSEAFPQTLHGEIDTIGTQVAHGDLSSTNPSSFSDSRVVEVKIRLDVSNDDSNTAARLIHGKVTAVIEQ